MLEQHCNESKQQTDYGEHSHKFASDHLWKAEKNVFDWSHTAVKCIRLSNWANFHFLHRYHIELVRFIWALIEREQSFTEPKTQHKNGF